MSNFRSVHLSDDDIDQDLLCATDLDGVDDALCGAAPCVGDDFQNDVGVLGLAYVARGNHGVALPRDQIDVRGRNHAANDALEKFKIGLDHHLVHRLAPILVSEGDLGEAGCQSCQEQHVRILRVEIDFQILVVSDEHVEDRFSCWQRQLPFQADGGNNRSRFGINRHVRFRGCCWWLSLCCCAPETRGNRQPRNHMAGVKLSAVHPITSPR